MLMVDTTAQVPLYELICCSLVSVLQRISDHIFTLTQTLWLDVTCRDVMFLLLLLETYTPHPLSPIPVSA